MAAWLGDPAARLLVRPRTTAPAEVISSTVVQAAISTSSSASLQMSLSREPNTGYLLDLRLDLPDAQAERAPVRTPVALRFDVLRTLQDHPDKYGLELAKSLFGGKEARDLLEQVLAYVRSASLSMRLQVTIDESAPELHALRWETLADPSSATPLALESGFSLSRFMLSKDWQALGLRSKNQLKALVAVANPLKMESFTILQQRLAPLDVSAELARARQALGWIPLEELTSRPDRPAQGTLARLIEVLRQGSNTILYLVCRAAMLPANPADPTGSLEPTLILENDVGEAYPTSGRELEKIITELNPAARPRLIVLSACQSARAGQEAGTSDGGALSALGPRLAEAGIPAVIAMQGNVTVQTVGDFMPVFFSELKIHGQIDRAMALARGKVRRSVKGGSRERTEFSTRLRR